MATAGAIGDAFRLANEFEVAKDEAPPYLFSVLSEEGGLLASSSNISIWTQRLERYSVADFHAFFVVCRDASAALDSNECLLPWITRYGSIASFPVQQGASLTVVCKDPKPSTVPIYLFDDGLDGSTTGNVAPTDMALTQIERDLGTDAARKIARVLNTSFIERAKPMPDDSDTVTTTEKIRESARWIKGNYSNPISVAQAAEFVAMSKRNFQRRFKFEFGITPLEYLLRTRFEVVCEMLRNTNLPVDKIARRCGMGDGNRLGRLFKEKHGMSPTQFRAQQHVEQADPDATSDDNWLDTADESLRGAL